MMEQEWLSGTDPTPMLKFLRGKASGRKRRLFAVACCRHLWRLFTDLRIRDAVETAELWADGRASPEELASHRAATRRALEEARLRALREADGVGLTWSILKFHINHQAGAFEAAADAMSAQTAHASTLGGRFPERAAWGAMLAVIPAIELGPLLPADGFQEGYLAGARLVQAALLRDLFGNPFQVVSVNPVWLLRGSGRAGERGWSTSSSTDPDGRGRSSDDGLLSHPHLQESRGWRSPFRPWERGPVAELAQAIYDKRAFERLPVLADALEQAGCSDEEILGHLRGPGPHVRGCWVIDLILSKS
ncbi:MAG TPA: hypothetical protein VH643_23585 [Gemmataceae bacterium]|jgi:hypothetical protein